MIHSVQGDPPAKGDSRLRVLVLDNPGDHGTTLANEIAAMGQDCDIRVLAMPGHPNRGPTRAEQRVADAMAGDLAHALAEIHAFRPDVLHAHALSQLWLIGQLAEMSGIPFTLRAQGPDLLVLRPQGPSGMIRQILTGGTPLSRRPPVVEALRRIQGGLCLGVLTLPCARPWLRRAGVDDHKLIDCWPATRFAALHDREPNGDGVLGLAGGAGTRAVPDIIKLARKVPQRPFTLFATPQASRELTRHLAADSASVRLVAPPDPDLARAELKRHRWLVVTQDAAPGGLMWPVIVAEAQAAGVGVCVPNLRPDLATYLGDGAGVLYDSIDELPGIVAGPVPDEMRERGFEQAKKSDVEEQRHLLSVLWQAGARRSIGDPVLPRQAAIALDPTPASLG